MSGHAERVAVGAIVVAALVAGLALELNQSPPSVSTLAGSSSGTSASTTGIANAQTIRNATGWFGGEAPPASCGNMSMGLDTTDGGPGARYVMDFYLPATPAGSPRSPGHWNYPIGSDLCVYTHLQIASSNSTSLPTGESVTVWATNATGTSLGTFYQGSCAAPTPHAGSPGANGTGWNCSVVWNTSQPYDGMLPSAETQYNTPGIQYWIRATVRFSASHSLSFGNAAPFGFYEEAANATAA